MDKAKIGLIGVGPRGMGLLQQSILPNPRYDIVAICDLNEDRMREAVKHCEEAGRTSPRCYTNYHELMEHPGLQGIVVATYIEMHFPVAMEAMRHGIPVGMEVGGAYSLQQCWDLVHCSEETGTPMMPLENCCYGQREMLAWNMAKQGLFGELVHCDGGYQHDCRSLAVAGDAPLMKNNRIFRSLMTQNSDWYPTHDLGPISQVLNINRGNRYLTLTSTASKSAGLHDYIMRNPELCAEPNADRIHFTTGDIVNTNFTCAGGETVSLTFEITLPRYYSRNFTVRGTRGFYEEKTDSIFLEDTHSQYHHQWREMWGNAKDYEDQYEHPVWKEYKTRGTFGAHGGMDGLCMDRFVASIIEKKPFDIDVYDAALWMSISVLSGESVAKGGMPVDIPDFTNGMWSMRNGSYGISQP